MPETLAEIQARLEEVRGALRHDTIIQAKLAYGNEDPSCCPRFREVTERLRIGREERDYLEAQQKKAQRQRDYIEAQKTKAAAAIGRRRLREPMVSYYDCTTGTMAKRPARRVCRSCENGSHTPNRKCWNLIAPEPHDFVCQCRVCDPRIPEGGGRRRRRVNGMAVETIELGQDLVALVAIDEQILRYAIGGRP
jgi:hypothetical protein